MLDCGSVPTRPTLVKSENHDKRSFVVTGANHENLDCHPGEQDCFIKSSLGKPRRAVSKLTSAGRSPLRWPSSTPHASPVPGCRHIFRVRVEGGGGGVRWINWDTWFAVIGDKVTLVQSYHRMLYQRFLTSLISPVSFFSGHEHTIVAARFSHLRTKHDIKNRTAEGEQSLN